MLIVDSIIAIIILLWQSLIVRIDGKHRKLNVETGNGSESKNRKPHKTQILELELCRLILDCKSSDKCTVDPIIKLTVFVCM